MKKLFFTLILFGVSSGFSQSPDDKAALTHLNKNVISSYKEGKLNDALNFAQQVLDVSRKIYGNKNAETAAAFTNLGIIQREKSKFKEAIVNLQEAVKIYETLGQAKELITAYETLAFTQFANNLNTESEANYLKAVETADLRYRTESKQSFVPTLNLANIFARNKNLEKADEFYLKSSQLAAKHFSKESKEFEQIESSRICFGSAITTAVERHKAFYDKRKEMLGELSELNVGILIGKAKTLPKPRYPPEARNQRLGGSVPVKVKIDEKGNVVEAKAICGHPSLGKVSEEAAIKAKFAPFIVDGKPAIVNGIIVYYYVP